MESLGLDWKLLLAQVVNFGLLYFVLKKLIFLPLMKVIDERNKKIESAIKNSKEIEERLLKVEEEKNKIIHKAELEAKKEKEELLVVAAIEKNRIIEDAKESAKIEVKKGLQNIESAKKDVVKNISDEYLRHITDKLYDRFSKQVKKDNYPLLKSLLKRK